MGDGFKIDFVGIGVPRGGSSWVHQCLGEHPDICVSSPKETKFFRDDALFARGLEFYKTMYGSCADDMIKKKGEFDPGYLYYPEALERINNLFPEAKIIVSLRNPIDRAHSHFFNHYLKEKHYIESFSKILEEPDNFYLRRSLYYQPLKKAIEIFGRERVIVLILEEIEKQPIANLKKLFRFVGVREDFVPPSAQNRVNYSGRFKVKIPSLNKKIYDAKKALTDSRLSGPMVSVFKILGFNKLRVAFRKWNMKEVGADNLIEKTDMSPELRRALGRYFREDVKNLERLLSRDLSVWSLE